jgi:glycolate oxidase
MERVHHALDEIVHETLRRGGTITGEHGVGLAKKPWLKLQTGDDSLNLMRRLKLAFDPLNLLNPGKMLD